jgi:succinate dehydrogenase / fumarate reductase flavoprotein subunit
VDLGEIDDNQLREERQRVFDPLERKRGNDPRRVKEQIQCIMWEYVGPLRNQERLAEAARQLKEIRGSIEETLFSENKSSRMNFEWMEALEIRSMIDVGLMIAESALFRTESRESHYREDFPTHYPTGDNQNWCVETGIRYDNGTLRICKLPLEFPEIQPGQGKIPDIPYVWMTVKA